MSVTSSFLAVCISVVNLWPTSAIRDVFSCPQSATLSALTPSYFLARVSISIATNHSKPFAFLSLAYISILDQWCGFSINAATILLIGQFYYFVTYSLCRFNVRYWLHISSWSVSAFVHAERLNFIFILYGISVCTKETTDKLLMFNKYVTLKHHKTICDEATELP